MMYEPWMTEEDRAQIAAHLAGQVVETNGDAYDAEYGTDDEEEAK